MARVINREISKYGEVVTIMPRTEIVSEEYGTPKYVFNEVDEFDVLAIIYEARGWIEVYEEIGVRQDIDYILLIHAKWFGYIKPGYLIRLPTDYDQIVEVDSIITRRLARKTQFLEALCRRRT